MSAQARQHCAVEVALVISARTGSRRLPNKVLLPLAGTTPLGLLIQRLGRSRWREGIVVATSVEPADDPVAELASRIGVRVHRGSEVDVLGRVADAARKAGASVVVRLTGDCPLNDPIVVDACVEAFRRSRADYVTTKYNFPMGIDCEVLGIGLLDLIDREAPAGPQREHVTLRIWEQPGLAESRSLAAPPELAAPEVVLALDTADDLRRLQGIAERIPGCLAEASTEQILKVVREEPSLMRRRAVPPAFPEVEWPAVESAR